MRLLLKEPLLHFLLAGALLFGVYAWRVRGAGAAGAARPQVRITEADVRALEAYRGGCWNRHSTPDEMRGLVRDFVKEELLAREARAMGLEENDSEVRHRLAAKMNFFVQDITRRPAPTDDDLRQFYAAHLRLFQCVSFTQVSFSPQKRKDAMADAKAALASLTQGAVKEAQVGDRLAGAEAITNADLQAIVDQFGRPFAEAVFSLPPGVWSGPLESAYGLQLVRVLKIGQPVFAEIKGQILEHWRNGCLREDSAKFAAGLLKKYDVVPDESVKPLVGKIEEDWK